jgi:hypothetical protein
VSREAIWATLILVLTACASPEARPSLGGSESAAATPETTAADAKIDTSQHIDGPVPGGYQRAVEFLNYIKMPAEDAKGGFDLSKGRFDDLARVVSYVSEHGLTLFDVNDSATTHVGRDTLDQQLRHRTGRGFEMLVHLSHIYAQPYPQYSRLTYQLRPNGIVVFLSDWYRLTFERENGQLRLTRLDYTELEGE